MAARLGGEVRTREPIRGREYAKVGQPARTGLGRHRRTGGGRPGAASQGVATALLPWRGAPV